MAEPAASQRGRISALLKSLPSATAFRLAEAAGLFTPLAPLVDRSGGAAPDEHEAGPGRIAATSLPVIWRWLSETAAPDAAGGFIEAFARAAFGSGLTPASLQSSLPRLRAMVGREALGSTSGWSDDRFAAALGSRRVGQDAQLAIRALSIAERLSSLRLPLGPELPQSFLRAARDIADDEPDARAVIAAYVLGQVGRTADATPLLLALAKRRDEHRLDRSDLASALNAAIEIACARGADRLDPDAVTPAEALEAALARARDVVDLAASLRGRVTDDWVRRLNARLARSDHRLDRLCESYGLRVREALAASGEELSHDAVESAVAAAGFLAQSTAVAGTLRFDETRMRAVAEVLRDLAAAADTVDERLQKLAQTSLDAAERAVELRGRVIGLFYDERAGRAWARHGRKVIGLPSFEELVLAPCEPVIVDDGVVPLRGGLIARSTVDAFWRWTVQGPLAQANEAARTAHAQERARSAALAATVVSEYRIVLSDAAYAAARGEAEGLDLKDPRTGRPQLAALAALLACEGAIRAHLDAWPPKLKHVAEAQVAEVRALHDALAVERPEVEPSLLILVMARLERPWQVLRMLERIAKTNSDILVEATEFSAVGEILIDWAEADAACFRIPSSEPFIADRALMALERFAGIVSGMTEEFQIRRNGAWGGRLYALKARAARHLEEICKAAVEAVEAATPRVTQHNGSWSADLSKPIDDYVYASAAQYARFLKGSKVLDHRAAFAGARSAAMTRVEGRLSAHVESLLDFAHAGENRDQALAALREIAVVLGEFEGTESRDVLLRRVAAA